MKEGLKVLGGAAGIALLVAAAWMLTLAPPSSQPLELNLVIAAMLLVTGAVLLPKSADHPFLALVLRRGAAVHDTPGLVPDIPIPPPASEAETELAVEIPPVRVASPPDAFTVATGATLRLAATPSARGVAVLGGLPDQTDTQPWPELDGCPARLLARVDPAALPEPFRDRAGDAPLTLFLSAAGTGRILALPQGNPLPDGYELAPDDSPRLSPCWLPPVACRVGLGQDNSSHPAPALPPVSPDWLDDPACRPFDWESAFCLVEAMGWFLIARTQPGSADPFIPPSKTKDLLLDWEASLHRLETSQEALTRIAGKLAFSGPAMSCLLDGLGDLEFPHFVLDADNRPAFALVRVIDRPEVRAAYLSLLGAYARTLPANALPEALRGTIERADPAGPALEQAPDAAERPFAQHPGWSFLGSTGIEIHLDPPTSDGALTGRLVSGPLAC